MPRDPKDSNSRELEEAVSDAPRVDESEVDEEERAYTVMSSDDRRIDFDEEDEYDVDEDDIIAEELDIEDLTAMEGPDA